MGLLGNGAHSVVVLNSEDAVRAFATTGNLTIGGNLSAAAGPIGTGGAVNASLLHPAPLFTYSKNKGLFAGISLEGSALVERVRLAQTSFPVV